MQVEQCARLHLPDSALARAAAVPPGDPLFDSSSHPLDEAARLAALRRLGVLDTPAEPGFDELVAAAAAVCGTPIALVSLVDEERQWFKARWA